jgi:hypothetical protein
MDTILTRAIFGEASMGLRDTVYDGLLAGLPADPAAHVGYFDLVEIWETLGSGRDRNISLDMLRGLEQNARAHMTERERIFFDEPHEDGLDPYLLQAKIAGRLSKILMDRHGFKVGKEGGGVG